MLLRVCMKHPGASRKASLAVRLPIPMEVHLSCFFDFLIFHKSDDFAEIIDKGLQLGHGFSR